LGATIRRGARPADHFTIISNALLRDGEISLKARGLAAWLLTHTAEFELSVERIAVLTQTGETAIKSGLRELETRGYLTRTLQRDARNRVTGSLYEISDTLPSSEPPVENPPAENRPVGNELDYKKTNSKKTTESKKTTTSAAAGVAPSADGLFPAEDIKSAEEVREAQGFTVKANDVVAAYVDAYRDAHQGHDPLQADTRKVAGTAARLIKDPAVKTHVLLQAATSLGRTQFTDLAGQYRRSLQIGTGQQDPTRGYFRAEQRNTFVPPTGESDDQANARVRAHMEWLKKFNAGEATMADKPRS
jgi:hypothetical protein